MFYCLNLILELPKFYIVFPANDDEYFCVQAEVSHTVFHSMSSETSDDIPSIYASQRITITPEGAILVSLFILYTILKGWTS